MRAIIRFSVNREQNGRLTNKLRKLLKTENGFTWTRGRTATYEHPAIDPHRLSDVMYEFWSIVHSELPSISIDHFWMYSDNPPKVKLNLKLKKHN